MTLQPDDTYLVFNVRETLLKDMRNGSVINVRIPALDKSVKAKVYFIQDMGSYANCRPPRPPAPSTPAPSR